MMRIPKCPRWLKGRRCEPAKTEQARQRIMEIMAAREDSEILETLMVDRWDPE